MQPFQCNATQHQGGRSLVAMFQGARTEPSNKLGVVDGLVSISQRAWGLATALAVPGFTVTVQ